MRKVNYLLVGLLCLAMTSCFDIIEEIKLNADGSGSYSMTTDMSKMFTDEFMKEMMLSSMKEETGAEQLEIDSLINFSEFTGEMPSGSLNAAQLAAVNKAQMRIQMSESKSKGMFIISFPFDNVEEVNTFQKAMQELGNQEGDEAGGMGGMLGGMTGGGSVSNFALKGRTLTRTVMMGEVAQAMGGENAEMMKMFLEDATYTTVYELPGQVKRTTIENAAVDGNKVTIVYDLLEMMDETPDVGGDIKFKRG